MQLEQAIRGRRTIKAYGSQPVDRAVLDELFELARWAPNHHLTQPWRFRVLGPESLDRLKQAAGPEAAGKLDRAPTLVLCTARIGGDPVQDEEDLLATACAAFIVLLAAQARGLGSYWRTPEVLRRVEGLTACGVGEDERLVALIHLGESRQAKRPPDRRMPRDFVTYLP